MTLPRTIALLVTMIMMSSTPAFAAGPYRVERLGDGPIIDRGTFVDAGIPDDGDNINGPSVLRVPAWIAPENRANPSAKYYLYFAHHVGRYIRMAWAESIEGPWTLFNPDASDDEHPGRGVLDLELGPGDEDARWPRIHLGDNLAHHHIASPDVHADDADRRIVMYFHGGGQPARIGYTGGQKTFVATSATELNFNVPAPSQTASDPIVRGEPGHGPRDALLGNAYMRVFRAHGRTYAYSNGGQLWRAPETSDIWAAPEDDPRGDAWERGPDPLGGELGFVTGDFADDTRTPPKIQRPAPRHAAVRRLDDQRIELMFSVVGDAPERIYRAILDASSPDWERWRIVGPIEEVLRPERAWEGAEQPMDPSSFGADTGVNQLRDPCLFTDDDQRTYLFYTGAGEAAIGVARLTPRTASP